ncbi:MAG: orotate phosphoribosyltransferase [Caldisphaera sp.]|jgi:orotate phosphoribosyltransferase|nr:orotate phosphoribosyltransferase [Caldisphaera sp.]PMP60477.1 MAG: orotate phosphoribosyltransferase [Caldisphaera sp.]PMP90492.1 MAG: orotate phosphoribosyltransferase [Caldisphaera sp.]
MQEMNEISLLLYETNSIKIGNFLLASGKTSSIYIDMRNMLGYPNGFKKVSDLLTNFAEKIIKSKKIDSIVGVATGGIPWATIISYKLMMPMSYVRPSKGHGTDSKIEGFNVNKKNCLIIDDVSTTGESIISAVKLIRSLGGIVDESLVIIDRNQGALSNLRNEGVNLNYLFSLKDILNSLQNQNLIEENIFRKINLELYGVP